MELQCFLVRPSGFEPLAFRLGGGCSILLSYGRRYEILRKRGPSAGVEHPLRRRSLYTTEQRDINRPASAGHTSYCTRFAPGCQSKTKPPRQFAAAFYYCFCYEFYRKNPPISRLSRISRLSTSTLRQFDQLINRINIFARFYSEIIV